MSNRALAYGYVFAGEGLKKRCPVDRYMGLSLLSRIDINHPYIEPYPLIAWTIGSACLTGVLLEVSTHPKPGLVTPRSMGSHADMDLQTFMLTSGAIAPCFHRCAAAGISHGNSLSSLLPVVRAIGVEYDVSLLCASNGVNTQRGALFVLGIVAAAAGAVYSTRRAFSPEAIFSAVSEITRGIVQRELIANTDAANTAGKLLYASHGVTGIRGEVEAGIPAVAYHGLPALKRALTAGHSLNRALVHALIAIASVTEDTTVMWRGGPEALEFVRSEAARINGLGGALEDEGLAEIYRFAEACIARRLSLGGAADLLAATAAIHLLDAGSFPVSATKQFEPLHSNASVPGENL